MPYIAQYLLKLSIGLAVVYLFYAVVLRRLTFHTWNRWYLLGYSLIAFFIPFIDINPLLERGAWNENMVVQLIPVVGKYEPAPAGRVIPGTWLVIAGTVLIGMLVMLIRLMVQYIALRKIRMRSELISDEQVKIYQVNKRIIPFSFGRSIFINQHLHNEQELKEIIRHEFIHVKQRHTADILWGELLCLLNWYNPFAWLIRRAIRQNLEFIADHHVLQAGLDRKQYQYLLLKVVGVSAYSITSQFNFSSLKKRIAMMNKMRSAKVHLVKFLFVLPLVTVLLLAFRTAAIKEELPGVTALPQVIPDQPAKYQMVTSVVDTVLVIMKDTLPAKAQFHQTGTAVKLRGVQVRNDSTRLFIDASLNGPSAPAQSARLGLGNDILVFVDGEEQTGEDPLHKIDPEQISSISVLKDQSATALYGERGKQGVILITTKEAKMKSPKEPLQLKLKPASVEESGRTGNPKVVINGVATRNGVAGFDGLIIVDGKPYDSTGFRKLDLPAERIQSVEVMKGGNLEAVYGPRARNGVIFIHLKKDDKITGNFDTRDGQQPLQDQTKVLLDDTKQKNSPFGSIADQLLVKYKAYQPMSLK